MLQCVVPSRTPVISPQIHLVWHRDRNRAQLLLLPRGIPQFITPLRPFCALRSPNCNHSFCRSVWTYLIDVSAKYYHRGLQNTQNNTAAAVTTTTAAERELVPNRLRGHRLGCAIAFLPLHTKHTSEYIPMGLR